MSEGLLALNPWLTITKKNYPELRIVGMSEGGTSKGKMSEGLLALAPWLTITKKNYPELRRIVGMREGERVKRK